MLIDKRLASQIISEINEVIPYKINIMNQEGYIIASSNTKRVNEIHKGARYLMKHHLDELRIQGDDEFDGGKPGVNFPIVVRSQVIGVLGITGDYEEISSFAQIIKRMSEILIQDELLKQEQMRQTFQINCFLYEWLHTRSTTQEKELYEKGILLGFDVRKKRRVFQLKVIQGLHEEKLLQMEHCIKQKLFGDKDAFVLRMSSLFIVGIRTCSDYELYTMVQIIQKELEVLASCEIYVGIDKLENQGSTLSQQYMEAKRAMQAGICQGKAIVYFKDIVMDLFLEEVSIQTKQEFIERIFKAYSLDELKSSIRMLECYYQHNGSIKRASEQLYLHKNTLQNRMNRIKEKTGFDPRALQDIPLFYIAIQFYRFLEASTAY